jgi:phage tail-like protein
MAVNPAAPGARVDPARNFNFLVEIDGYAQASFTECSGLETTTEVIETREGGDNTTVHKLPGKTTYSDITLKRGVTASDELWKWRESVIHGDVRRKNGSIVVFDLANAREISRWNFVSAWPTKWEGPQLTAKGTDIAVETLVLAHEGIARAA